MSSVMGADSEEVSTVDQTEEVSLDNEHESDEDQRPYEDCEDVADNVPTAEELTAEESEGESDPKEDVVLNESTPASDDNEDTNEKNPVAAPSKKKKKKKKK